MTPSKLYTLDKKVISSYQMISLSTNFKNTQLKLQTLSTNMWSWIRAKQQFGYQKLTEETKNGKQTRCDKCAACNCQGHSNKSYKEDDKKS